MRRLASSDWSWYRRSALTLAVYTTEFSGRRGPEDLQGGGDARTPDAPGGAGGVGETSGARQRALGQAPSSREVILYLKVSGSRLSLRPSPVSACGYMRNATASSLEPGSRTSCA